MAVTFGASIGGANVASTDGDTLTITTTATATVGQLIAVRVASDNQSATLPTFTATDSAGNTYTQTVQQAVQATGNAGVSGAILTAPVTTELASGGTITITQSDSRLSRSCFAQTFNGVGSLRASGTSTNSGTASTAATVTNTQPVTGDLVIGAIMPETYESPSAYDTDSTNGSWDTAEERISGTGTTTSRVMAIGQNKIVTGTGSQTYNVTLNANADWVAMIAVFEPAAAPSGSKAGWGIVA